MKSRGFYIGAVLLLLGTALVIPKNYEEENNRVWQHEAAKNQMQDTNLSIEPDAFSSHLPVIVIETNGREIPGKVTEDKSPNEIEHAYIQAELKIINQESELNTLKSEAEVASKVNIRMRGNTSRYYEKAGYLFQFINEDESEQKQEVLGMEAHSTWILNASYVDKTQMRNYMWYNLAGEIMEWAPDVRFCEVFLNGEYQGLYTVIEKISTGEGRIQLTDSEAGLAETSYVLELDRQSVNTTAWIDSFAFHIGMQEEGVQQLAVEYPGKSKLTPEMIEYITDDISTFEKALYSYDYSSKTYGYYNRVDVDNFVDYLLISEISRNLDAGRHSTYIYKDVNGKLKLCVWDFDNCCNNYLADPFDETGFIMPKRVWYQRICKDEKFIKQVIEHYRELREDLFSDANIEKQIADIEAYLGCAIDRNYKKWGIVFTAEGDEFAAIGRPLVSYEEAIEQYKSALLGRLAWLDEHIEALYFYSHESVNKKYNY